MPTVFYSLITIIATAIVSLGLLFRLRKDHLLVSRSFFWHWALGFAIFSLVHVPVLVVNLGIPLSFQYCMGLCYVSIFVTLVAYLLLYRGATLLLTQNKFWLNKFSSIIFLIIAILVLSLYFVFKVGMFTIVTIFSFSLIFPINLYLASVFLYLYGKGCLWDGHKKRPSTIILSLGWFLVLILDIIFWYLLFNYPSDFWIMKLASLKGWYLARAIAHILILMGFLIYTRCWQYSKITKKTQK